MTLVVEEDADVEEDEEEVVVEEEVLMHLLKKTLARNLRNPRNRLSGLDALQQRRHWIVRLYSKMPRTQELKNTDLYLTLKMDMAGMKVGLVVRAMLLRMRNDLFDEELGRLSLILEQAHPRFTMVVLEIL